MNRFDKEKDELLIESVKTYNALYNKSDKEHKNNVYKHKCWENISRIVGVAVVDCKKRWKSLRDQYNKKVREYGTESGKVNSNWEYIHIMSFLTDTKKREAISFERDYSDMLHDYDSDADILDPNVNVNAGIKAESLNFEEIDIDIGPTALESPNDWLGPSTSKKRKPTSKIKPNIDNREGHRERETHANSDRQSAIKKFFESMAEVVETFPPRDQAVIRAKVCQLVSDTEIKLSTRMSMTPISEDSWSSDPFHR